MATRIQLRRGLKAALPSTLLLAGEPLFSTDRGTLHGATDATTKIPIVPAIEDLATLASINGPADFLIIHDADGTGQKEKKILFDNFKAALNIPAGATDEKVAVVSGGTAGYIWGTDGTNGVLRMGATMGWTKEAGNGFVTIDIAIVDGGAF